MDEDTDEDDKPLVRPASRKEPAKDKSDLDTGDEDLLPLVPPRPPPVQCEKGKDLQYGRIQLPYWKHEVPKDSRERTEDTSIMCRKAEGEAPTQHHKQVVGRP